MLFTPIKVGRRGSDGSVIAHACVIFPEIESELPRHIVVLNLEDVQRCIHPVFHWCAKLQWMYRVRLSESSHGESMNYYWSRPHLLYAEAKILDVFIEQVTHARSNNTHMRALESSMGAAEILVVVAAVTETSPNILTRPRLSPPGA